MGHVLGGRGDYGAIIAPGCQGLEGTGEPGAPLPPLWDEESLTSQGYRDRLPLTRPGTVLGTRPGFGKGYDNFKKKCTT